MGYDIRVDSVYAHAVTKQVFLEVLLRGAPYQGS